MSQEAEATNPAYITPKQAEALVPGGVMPPGFLMGSVQPVVSAL